MGKGAYMIVRNKTRFNVKISVHDIECMYDNGDEGSQLSSFDGVILGPNESYPTNSTSGVYKDVGLYIEAKSSGGCAFEISYFYMGFTILNATDFGNSSNPWQILVPITEFQYTFGILDRVTEIGGTSVPPPYHGYGYPQTNGFVDVDSDPDVAGWSGKQDYVQFNLTEDWLKERGIIPN